MKTITIPFILSIAILAVGMGFAYAHFANLDAQVILHFDASLGPDYVGDAQDVFLIILSGMGIALINFLLARALRDREQFLPTVLSISSIFISSLILIATFVIISNNWYTIPINEWVLMQRIVLMKSGKYSYY